MKRKNAYNIENLSQKTIVRMMDDSNWTISRDSRTGDIVFSLVKDVEDDNSGLKIERRCVKAIGKPYILNVHGDIRNMVCVVEVISRKHGIVGTKERYFTFYDILHDELYEEKFANIVPVVGDKNLYVCELLNKTEYGTGGEKFVVFCANPENKFVSKQFASVYNIEFGGFLKVIPKTSEMGWKYPSKIYNPYTQKSRTNIYEKHVYDIVLLNCIESGETGYEFEIAMDKYSKLVGGLNATSLLYSMPDLLAKTIEILNQNQKDGVHNNVAVNKCLEHLQLMRECLGGTSQPTFDECAKIIDEYPLFSGDDESIINDALAQYVKKEMKPDVIEFEKI
ncbi:MAG: hypothetical protein IJ542_00025 [Clostridia bacterium]|nr:hypothetical protein [Clostridia bacterium]